ncbi:MAG: DUF2914 domain-containing protein [Bacteroidota bacterium]
MKKRSAGYFAAFVLFTLLGTPFSVQAQNASQTSTNENSFPKDDTLYVKQIVLAKDVVERTPIDVVQSFNSSDQEGWCFARVYNSLQLTKVRFLWYYEEQKYFTFDAKVGQSPNWRTYSSVTLQEGSWRVVLEGPKGRKLDEIRFYVSD